LQKTLKLRNVRTDKGRVEAAWTFCRQGGRGGSIFRNFVRASFLNDPQGVKISSLNGSSAVARMEVGRKRISVNSKVQ